MKCIELENEFLLQTSFKTSGNSNFSDNIIIMIYYFNWGIKMLLLRDALKVSLGTQCKLTGGINM